MLDREGFRPNVGIVLLNARNQVFWGKRLRTHSWQFPQGGIKYGESPEQAMLRELHEEVGLLPEHVRILARMLGVQAHLFMQLAQHRLLRRLTVFDAPLRKLPRVGA